MELYVNISFIEIFYLFFWFSNIDFFRSMILPMSQLQTQKVMTSQIRSHRIFNADLLYLCAHFVVEIDEKYSHNGGF